MWMAYQCVAFWLYDELALNIHSLYLATLSSEINNVLTWRRSTRWHVN
jgi:hypothetical protein